MTIRDGKIETRITPENHRCPLFHLYRPEQRPEDDDHVIATVGILYKEFLNDKDGNNSRLIPMLHGVNKGLFGICAYITGNRNKFGDSNKHTCFLEIINPILFAVLSEFTPVEVLKRNIDSQSIHQDPSSGYRLTSRRKIPNLCSLMSALFCSSLLLEKFHGSLHDSHHHVRTWLHTHLLLGQVPSYSKLAFEQLKSAASSTEIKAVAHYLKGHRVLSHTSTPDACFELVMELYSIHCDAEDVSRLCTLLINGPLSPEQPPVKRTIVSEILRGVSVGGSGVHSSSVMSKNGGIYIFNSAGIAFSLYPKRNLSIGFFSPGLDADGLSHRATEFGHRILHRLPTINMLVVSRMIYGDPFGRENVLSIKGNNLDGTVRCQCPCPLSVGDHRSILLRDGKIDTRIQREHHKCTFFHLNRPFPTPVDDKHVLDTVHILFDEIRPDRDGTNSGLIPALMDVNKGWFGLSCYISGSSKEHGEFSKYFGLIELASPILFCVVAEFTALHTLNSAISKEPVVLGGANFTQNNKIRNVCTIEAAIYFCSLLLNNNKGSIPDSMDFVRQWIKTRLHHESLSRPSTTLEGQLSSTDASTKIKGNAHYMKGIGLITCDPNVAFNLLMKVWSIKFDADDLARFGSLLVHGPFSTVKGENFVVKKPVVADVLRGCSVGGNGAYSSTILAEIGSICLSNTAGAFLLLYPKRQLSLGWIVLSWFGFR